MLLYSIILFLHVAGALGVGAALGIEWTGLTWLRSAPTLDAVRFAMGSLKPLRYIGMTSLLLLLASGAYMSATRWGMQPWIVTALVGMVAMGVLGGAVAGRRFGTIGAAMGQAGDRLTDSLRAKLLDQGLLLSLYGRAGLLVGILLLMTVRPGWVGAAAALLTPTAAGVLLVIGRRLPAADEAIS